jgi:hypothetical protein
MLLHQEIPIREGNGYSLTKIADLLDINKRELAIIIGINESTLYRNKDKISPSIKKKIQPLISILVMLWELSEWDINGVKKWLHYPQTRWSGSTPIDMIKIGRIDTVKMYLDQMLKGEVMGG